MYPVCYKYLRKSLLSYILSRLILGGGGGGAHFLASIVSTVVRAWDCKVNDGKMIKDTARYSQQSAFIYI